MLLAEEMQKLGLSGNESRAYIALSSMKGARASEIAKVTRIPRNKIYAVMEGLHRKGFVEILPEKVIRFRAVPFDSAFLLFLEAGEKRLAEMKKKGESIANQLKNVHYEKSETGEFTVYKSRRLIYKKLSELIQSAAESVMLCMEIQQLRRFYFLFKNAGRNISTSVITKIGGDTKAALKKWTPLAEVKHTENMPQAKILIVDDREAFVFHTESPVALHSTDRSFVSLMKNFAGMLWDSAVPARERILWLETGKPVEETRIIKSRKEFYRELQDLYRSTKKDVIILTTPNGIVRISKYIRDAMLEARSEGVRIRCLAAINKSNLDAARAIPAEVRHIEKTRTVLSCHDNSQLLLIQIKEDTQALDSPEDTAVLINQQSAVSTFRFILESMWKQAQQLEERALEIETGKPAETVKFIRGEEAIYDITKDTSAEAREMVCNISTEDSPERAFRFGTISTDEALAKRGIKLKYIYPITRKNIEFVRKIMEFAEVRHIDSSPMRVRLIDSSACLIRHLEEEALSEKFCIFSNASNFVSAIQMFFEKTWSVAIPAEERIRQLEKEDVETEEAKKLITQYKERSLDEFVM